MDTVILSNRAVTNLVGSNDLIVIVIVIMILKIQMSLQCPVLYIVLHIPQ